MKALLTMKTREDQYGLRSPVCVGARAPRPACAVPDGWPPGATHYWVMEDSQEVEPPQTRTATRRPAGFWPRLRSALSRFFALVTLATLVTHATPAPGQLSLHSPCYVACFLKPMMGGAAYPSGAADYWTMNEAALSTRVDGPGTLDLTESSSVISGAGKNGNAAFFGLVAGVGNSLTSAGSFSSTPNGYTFMMWAYATSDGSIFATLDDGADGFVRLKLGSDGVVNWSPGEETSASDAGPYALETWHLLVGVSSQTRVAVSVDGGTFIEGSINGAPQATLAQIQFRADGPGTAATAAGVDEPAFFARIWTQQEVTDAWNAGVGRFGP